MILPGVTATVTASKVPFLLSLTRNSQDLGPPPLALTFRLSQWTSPRTRPDTAFPRPSGSRAVVSKCPAREKEAVTGERVALAPQGDHCLLRQTCVLRYPCRAEPEDTAKPAPALQEPSPLKEDLPTHETSGEAGLSAAQALLETSAAPMQPLGSTAAVCSHRPGPPGTRQRELSSDSLPQDTASHGNTVSLGLTLSAGSQQL